MHYLVVAHQTADSPELVQAVSELAKKSSLMVTLLVPATPAKHLLAWTEGEARAIASEQANLAQKGLEAAGIDVVGTEVGDANPFNAVRDALRDAPYDAVLVSTFPLRKSRWQRMNLIERLESVLEIPVIHVVAHSKE